MERADFKKLSKSLLDIAWIFGPKGLDGVCCQDLGMAEFLALDGISRIADCPVYQVGHTLGFTKSGATRVVNRLVSKGYILKRTAGHDARVCCLAVTERGFTILFDAYARYESILEHVFKDLDHKAVDRMKEALLMFASLIVKNSSQEEIS